MQEIYLGLTPESMNLLSVSCLFGEINGPPLANFWASIKVYWTESIAHDFKVGKTVLVTAHGNSLRAVVKHLEGISDEDIAGLLYELEADLKPVKKGGEYLDPAAAADAIKAVANQGKK